jgi:mannosyltransferase OCH1-like enzyme
MIEEKPPAQQYEYMLFSDLEQKQWVQKTYPLVYSYYMDFKYDIQRCDFWKFLVIYHYGGFYFDADVDLMQDIDTWYDYEDTNGTSISILLGIEADTPKDVLAKRPTWRPQQLASWAFASVAKHPILEYLLHLILSKRTATYNGPSSETNGTVFERSKYHEEVAEFASPAVLTDAVASYLLFTKNVEFGKIVDRGGNVMIGDLYVAGIKAFACGNTWSIG